MNVFVDTGPFIAFDDPRDQHHANAVAGFSQLREDRLVTSLPVLTETATRCGRLLGSDKTATLLRLILSNKHYNVLDASRQVFIEALDLMVKYADPGLSLTDCTTIIIMRALRIRRIFTFDTAFRRVGFEVIP
jgi:predicted nucleic acid-binding protein